MVSQLFNARNVMAASKLAKETAGLRRATWFLTLAAFAAVVVSIVIALCR
jgi:hypothetical protein